MNNLEIIGAIVIFELWRKTFQHFTARPLSMTIWIWITKKRDLPSTFSHTFFFSLHFTIVHFYIRENSVVFHNYVTVKRSLHTISSQPQFRHPTSMYTQSPRRYNWFLDSLRRGTIWGLFEEMSPKKIQFYNFFFFCTLMSNSINFFPMFLVLNLFQTNEIFILLIEIPFQSVT